MNGSQPIRGLLRMSLHTAARGQAARPCEDSPSRSTLLLCQTHHSHTLELKLPFHKENIHLKNTASSFMASCPSFYNQLERNTSAFPQTQTNSQICNEDVKLHPHTRGGRGSPQRWGRKMGSGESCQQPFTSNLTWKVTTSTENQNSFGGKN